MHNALGRLSRALKEQQLDDHTIQLHQLPTCWLQVNRSPGGRFLKLTVFRFRQILWSGLRWSSLPPPRPVD